MAEVSALTQVVRGWQLPLTGTREVEAVRAVADRGLTTALKPEDLALVLGHQSDLWEQTGKIEPLLKTALDAALDFTPKVLDNVNARSYLGMYQKLRDGSSDVAKLSHAVARRLLSRASLVAHLLREEKFSCSQVARLLSATEGSLDVSYGAVRILARELRLDPALDRKATGQLIWDEDRALSLALFPDSSLAETSSMAASDVEIWLPEIDVERLLTTLSRSDRPSEEPFWPYLQMLHWCLTPVEFYDHPASYLYEFAPRGHVAAALFAQYPAATGNPVLNNAKAVETLNSTWARNRGGDDAHALVSLLGTVESLPFVSRRQVARVMRAWLWRTIELRSVEPRPLDVKVDDEFFVKFTEHVTNNETHTQGVIEQRVVDCLAVLAYGGGAWRSRGLGDGVNASNLSRHKLGDVEFSNVNERAAIALEAHGGYLSATYVANHTHSLGRIIAQRLAESWEILDDPEAWTIRVLFVAHSREMTGLPVSDVSHGVNVVYEYLDYNELLTHAMARSAAVDRIAAFEDHVVSVLNSRTVRESARECFRKIMEAK